MLFVLIPTASLASTTIEAVTVKPLMVTLGNVASYKVVDECLKHFLAVSAKQTVRKLEC